MPFLCCGSKTNEDVAQQEQEGEVASSAAAANAGTTKKEEEKDEGEGDDNNINSTREREERELAESIYHDARQSLTASMVYKPATSMISSRMQKLDLDTKPQDLLKSHNISTSATATATATGTGGGYLDSVAVVKEGLVQQGGGGSISQPGYPGELTDQELEACLEFRKLVKQKRQEDGEDSIYYEMVHILDGIEDEAFAICRIMRARKFVVADVFKLLDESLIPWKEGRANMFYPKLDCPMSLVYTQFPLLQSGISKNGSLVFYVQVGKISLEAIQCFTEIDNLVPYIWNLLVHSFREHATKLQQRHPDKTILAELTLIADLNGIQRSLFTEQVMTTLKKVVSILNCFPEILSKAIITNAPYFFSVIWMVFKQLMDARTTAKVDIYSNEQKGIACIQQYIDTSQLLSDYGGTGPSCNEVMDELVKQNGNDQGGRGGEKILRRSVERLFLNPKGKASCEFELLDNTEKATVMVFTRSTTGAHFTVSSSSSGGGGGGGGGGNICEVEVLQKPSSDGDNNIHPYSKEVATVQGPGNFQVSCKSNSNQKAFFLVQVSVLSNMAP